MNVVHIVVKNTSTLDYSIPYLCSLRKKFKDATITVLYCAANRKQILRNSQYYDKIFDEYGVEQLDYSDFLKVDNLLFKFFWRSFFAISYYDNVSLRSFIKHPLFLKGNVIKHILAGPRKKLDRWLCSRFVDPKSIFQNLDPNLIVFDHRGRIDIVFEKEFSFFFKEKKIPVILVPHAAHVDNETDECVPFTLSDEAFPHYCDHWSCFRYAKPFLLFPTSKKSQFAMIGHPGLDSSWLTEVILGKSLTDKKKVIQNKLRVLVLSRRFIPKNMKKPEGMDPGVLEFAEVVSFFRKIDSALKATQSPYEIIVKPHPSSSFPENMRALKEAKLKNFRISYEPFFDLLGEIDLTITEFSSSVAFSVLGNVPTILLNSPLQDYAHSLWFRLEELYTGLRYFVENPDQDLVPTLKLALRDNLKRNMWLDECENPDIAHFRKFYEDKAVSRALARTEYLLK